MGSRRVGHDWATSLSIFTFMHWRRKWQPTPVFLPGESQGRGSLVGCRLWGHTESDMTEVTRQQQQQLAFWSIRCQQVAKPLWTQIETKCNKGTCRGILRIKWDTSHKEAHTMPAVAKYYCYQATSLKQVLDAVPSAIERFRNKRHLPLASGFYRLIKEMILTYKKQVA